MVVHRRYLHNVKASSQLHSCLEETCTLLVRSLKIEDDIFVWFIMGKQYLHLEHPKRLYLLLKVTAFILHMA